MSDFIIWYAKRKADPQGRPVCKCRELVRDMQYGPEWGSAWRKLQDGTRYRVIDIVKQNEALAPHARLFTSRSMEPSGPMRTGMLQFTFEGKEYNHPRNGYGTTQEGMKIWRL